MANFNNIKHEIDQNVNTNGVQAITGAILNETLKDMIDEVDSKKQDTLVAGSGIAINGNVISATGSGSGDYEAGFGINSSELQNGRITVDPSQMTGNGINQEDGHFEINPNIVQEKLTAGQNITISSSNVISATDTTYSAGQGLDLNGTTFSVDYNEVQEKLESGQNIKTVNGYSLLGSGDIVIGGGGGGNYLPLEGGTLQNTAPGEDTELKVIDGMDEDYVKIVAPESQGEKPHVEIFENGSGDTKIYYDHIERGSQVSIDLPSSSGTLALTTDIPEAGSGLIENQNGEFEVDTTAIQEKLVAGQNITIQGNVISASGGSGQSYVAGNGIDITGNTISVDNTVATTSDLAGYLPLTGGNLQASNIATEVRVKSPSDDSYVYLHAVDSGSPTIKFHRDIQNPSNGEVHEITLHDERLDIERWDQTGNTWEADTLYFPQFKTGTIALDTDLAGKQDTLTAGTGITIQNNVISATGGSGQSYTAGTGINIDSNNVISNTAPGLWTSGTGTNSLVSPASVNAGRDAAGTGAIMAGDGNSIATGSYSTVFGHNNSSTVGSYTLVSGSSNTITGSNSAAFGEGLRVRNNSEIAVGQYNSSNIYDPTHPWTTRFSVGNGSSSVNLSNAFEIRSNGKVLVNGVGGYTGSGTDNTSNSLQDVINGKQDTLTAGTGITIQNNVISATGGGGGGLWSSGTGTNSLLSPSAVASSATASGTGALNAGYYNGQSGYASFANGDYSANFGTNNKVSYANSFASGLGNTTGGHEAFVGGGASNTASGDCSAVIGGTFGSAVGDNSVVIASGANGTANGNHSVAIGNATASGYGAIAIGEESSTNANHAISIAGADATGVNSVAIGKKVGTNNENEIGLGFANKVYTSGTGSIKSAFTVGNGTFSNGNYTYSNGLELKGNSDFYVYGVGGFDGTNSYNGNNSGNRAKTLQEVLNDKQDTLIAGQNITIQNNVISATGGGGSGLWTSGTGTGSVMSPGATQANGNYSVSGGDGTRANGTGSVALGGNTTASGTYSTALGAGSSATNSYTVAIGHGVQAANQNETALGAFNLYTNSGTSAQKTFFTVGNGTGTNAKSNLIEAKENNDIYVVGVGNYDGTNAGATGVQTLQDAINNGGGGASYTAGAGITIDQNNEISANPDGSNIVLDSDDRLNLDFVGVAGNLQGTGLQVDSNTGATLEVNFAEIPGNIAGNGLQDSGNGTLEIDTTTIASDLSSSFLPLEGGALQEVDTSYPSTNLYVFSPDSAATGYIYSYSEDTSDPQNPIPAFVELGLQGQSSGSADTTQGIYLRSNGTIAVDYIVDSQGNTDMVELEFPRKASGQTYTLATLDDIQGGGSSYTAGTGINIDANNVITNTAPDPGVLVAGAGNKSLKLDAISTSADGNYSIALGAQSHADGAYSFAAGQWASATRNSSIALGDNASSSANYALGVGQFSSASGVGSVAIGQYSEAKNTDEIGLGKYNSSINTGTTAEKTQFTVGNGTAYNSRSNLIEAKQNNDIYVLGIGGFDGTNASSALTLQTVINSKQNQLVSGVDVKTINGQSIVGGGNLVISGGSGLWTSGTGQNSLVSPGAAASSQGSDASGIGSIVIGDDSNANGDYSFAHGQGSMANGDYSAAFCNSNSTGDYSFAAGSGADAQADYSVALGGGIVVSDNSDPENPIDALRGVAIGEGATVNGVCGLAFMGGTATGEYSVAMGDSANATEMYSTALTGSTASGNYSFAASSGIAHAHYSTALSGAEAFGEGAFAAGQGNKAYGYGAAALGYMAQTYSQANGTDVSDANAGEVALGRYNYSEQGIVFTVGCGYVDNTDPNNPVDVRQNAIAIDSDGKIFLKGLGGYTGTSVSGCTDLVSFLNNL